MMPSTRLYFLLSLLMLVISSCCQSPKKEAKKPDLFWYTAVFQSPYGGDTTTIEDIPQSDPQDSMMAVFGFDHLGKSYSIAVFNNSEKAPIDGDQIYYNLEDLGIIFFKHLSWNNGARLTSTNDSINDLVNRAFEVIVFHSKDYRIPPPPKEMKIPPFFIEPEIK